MLDPREPWSTYTAPIYALVGVGLYWLLRSPEAAVMALSMIVLSVGTAAMHYEWSDFTSSLDHAGMNATYLALLTYVCGGGALAMGTAALAGAVLIEVVMDRRNYILVAICVWAAIVAAFATAPVTATAGALLMLGGSAFWLTDGDIEHSIWHLATGLGTGLLFLAQTMIL